MFCYEYVGFIAWWSAISSEAAAAWVGAFGTVLAIAVTAAFYAVDKWLAWKQRESDKLDEAAQSIVEIWVRARLLLPAMMTAQTALNVIADNLQRPSSAAYFVDDRGIAGLDVMIESFDQFKYFDASVATDLVDFVAYGRTFDRVVKMGVPIRDADAIQTAQLLKGLAERILTSLRLVTRPS